MKNGKASFLFGVIAIVLLGIILGGQALMANDEEAGEDMQVFASPPQGSAVATFAGGCFWCMEPPYDKVPGVLATISGYTGGHLNQPSYRQVTSGTTGHAEAVQVIYDPSKVTYDQLLDIFWRNIDPLVKDRQFCDVGSQYRTAIFAHNPEQRTAARETLAQVKARFEKPVYTEIVDAGPFFAAEDYHQDYYIKSSARYKYYRWSCGRDRRLEELWGE